MQHRHHHIAFLPVILAVALVLASCADDQSQTPSGRIIALCEADGENPVICQCIAETLADHLDQEDMELVAKALETGRNSDAFADLLARKEFEEAFLAGTRCSEP